MLPTITVIIIIIILYIFMCCKSTVEPFSASKTNVVFSDFVIEDPTDKYANVSEEILVLTQVPGLDRKTLYTYLRTPIGKFLAVYAKKVDGTVETTVSTVIVKMDKMVSEIMPLLKKSGIIDINTTDNIKYYVKLLTDPKYQVEQSKLTGVKEVYRKYNLCVKSHTLASGAKKAAELCKKEYNI